VIRYIPNIITLSRVVLTPLMIYFMLFEKNYIFAFIVFVVASITDFFDGRMARKYNIESRVGVFIDPLADKLLIMSAFISFLFIDDIGGRQIVSVWMIVMISFRDILVTLIRIIMESKGVTMVTSKVAKLKTFLQIKTIIVLFLYLQSGGYMSYDYVIIIMKSLMVVTTLITFYTGVHYFRYNYKTIVDIFAISD